MRDDIYSLTGSLAIFQFPDVAFEKLKVGMRKEKVNVLLITGGKVVKNPDFFRSVFQQIFYNIRTDEPCASCD